MRWIGMAAGAAALMASAAMIGARQSKEPSDLVVHEWGTFLSMSGSDGISLDGMYHEEHALPGFVHSRSRDQLKLRSVITKGETPVIYFYTDRRQSATVQVKFPSGLWTQWYPQATHVGPAFAQGGSPPRLSNGHIEWEVGITPASLMKIPPAIPKTDKDALWNYARDVDAAYVNAVDHTRPGNPNEPERFIFYRGLGQALLPVEMDNRAGGTVTCSGSLSAGVRHLFVIRVEKGRGAFQYVKALDGGESKAGLIPAESALQPLEQFVPKVRYEFTARLVGSGLYEKEARAMVNTWKESYFRTDGVRAIFMLPQSWTDETIPLGISPQPKQIVRVMVGRVEMLTPDRERRAENAIRDLASTDPGLRMKQFEYLRMQGRYVEPIVKRVLATTKDPQVRMLCTRLLVTDFVTELRSAVNNATDGSKLPQKPVWARAQLASLLREVGLNEEAKAEAGRALQEIGQMHPPDIKMHDARHYLRGMARTMEGLGNERGALESYQRLVEFGSQTPACGGCHDREGPSGESFFRDWWAGRKFAQYAVKTGQADKLIAARESSLSAKQAIKASRMMLAYLYEAKGDSAKAERMWAILDPSASPLRSGRLGAAMPNPRP